MTRGTFGCESAGQRAWPCFDTLHAFPGLSIYHLTKWAIEGFFEAYAQEVERFGIRTTLIEPGMASTSFYGGGDPLRAPALEVYEGTELTPWLRGTGANEEDMPGDPRKMAEAMIHIAESEDPPRRQLLGSDAYAIVRDELTERLRALEDSAASHCPPTARGDEPARVIAQDPVSAPVVVCALERGLEMSLPWRTNR